MSFVIELDDNRELDILKCLLDPYLPSNIVILNSEYDLFNYKGASIDAQDVTPIYKACRFLFDERDETKFNYAFSYIM